MQRMKHYCWLLLLAPCVLPAQPKLPEPGQLDPAVFSKKTCAFDASAGAVELFHYAETMNNDGQMMTTHRRRFLVLSKAGVEAGSIQVPFYSYEGYQSISEVNGETANAGVGNLPIWTKLESSGVFYDKLDNRRSVMKVNMPNVKEGSVFELRYTVTSKSYGALDYWDFQGDWPVELSAYLLEVNPRLEFAYSVQRDPKYYIDIKPMADVGKVYFEMRNVPSLEYEPYMDAMNNYRQRVIFQLSAYNAGTGASRVNQTWEQLVRSLLAGDQYGSDLNKKLSVPDLEAQVLAAGTTAEKVTAIYEYVKKKVKWDGYVGVNAPEGVKHTLETGEGSVAETNLLLLNLLLHFGIQAYPLLAADRDFGKVQPDYPFVDRFNRVVAYAIIDSSMQPWIMDATEKKLPAFVTPYQLLNTVALVVDKKKPRLIKVVRSDRFEKIITLHAELDRTAGNMKGKVVIARKGYARYAGTRRFGSQAVNPIAAVDDEQLMGATILKAENVPPVSDTAAAEKHISYKQEIADDAGILYYNSNLLITGGLNPFNASKRLMDVNFGYPIVLRQEERVKLPPGSALKEPPTQPELQQASIGARLKRTVQMQGEELVIVTELSQTETLIPATRYLDLKMFYASVMKALQVPLVISLGR